MVYWHGSGVESVEVEARGPLLLFLSLAVFGILISDPNGTMKSLNNQGACLRKLKCSQQKRGSPLADSQNVNPPCLPYHPERFHGEHKGLTEDAFLSAAIKLSHACLGGIDAKLSEVSSDYSFEEDDEGEGGVVGGEKQRGAASSSCDDKGRQQEATR